MMTTLVSMYNDGAITADHLVGDCLQMIDPKNPGLVMDLLPEALFDNILKFIEEYKPGKMAANYGLMPAMDQVEAARAWIEGKKSFVTDDARDEA